MSTKQPVVAAIITNKGISVIKDGKTYCVSKSSPFFVKVKNCLKNKNYKELEKHLNPAPIIAKLVNGKAEYKFGKIYFAGKPLHNALADRLIKQIKEGFDFKPLMKFLENCMANPRPEAVDELFMFLEANSLPVTDDGHFLAYKFVNKDLTSCHANLDGSYNENRVGSIVKMRREEVYADRNITCAAGLHNCGFEYCKGSEKIVITKVNPKNVVAIPIDYNNQKLRACEYEVVAIHEEGSDTEGLKESSVYKAGGSECEAKTNKPKRGKNGRFVSKKKK